MQGVCKDCEWCHPLSAAVRITEVKGHVRDGMDVALHGHALVVSEPVVLRDTRADRSSSLLGSGRACPSRFLVLPGHMLRHA